MSDFLTKRMIKLTYDTAANDAQGVSNKTAAAHPTGVFIPDNAIITSAFYEVETTFTSATDSATIAIMVEGAGDLVGAIAISDASNIWDAGLHGTLTAGTTTLAEAAPPTRTQIVNATDIIAGYVKIDGVEEVTFTVAVDVLTAGKLNLYIEYVVGV